MTMLDERYGNPHRILAAYKREIKSWPTIASGDSAVYSKFQNFPIKCNIACSNNICNTLDSPDTICLLLTKLPGYIRERWNRCVLQLRKREFREPSMADLLSMFDEECTLVNDPVFS